jgi:hypothetical protein
MCWGGGSDNSQMIAQQQKEADDARRKEDERQARIKAGLARIKAAYEGTDTFRTTAGTPIKIGAAPAGAAAGAAVAGLPAGYTYSLQGATPATSRSVSVKDAHSMANTVGYETVPGQPGTLMVKGPDGKLYNAGDTITPTTKTRTGHSGGFDATFFDKFKNAITGYYMPQVAQQFGDARDELTYRLARAGLGESSAGNTEYADLIRQNALNEAAVRDKASKATGDLKTSITNQRATAENQLSAAENPDPGANQALAAVRNISAAPTDLSPLASVFNLAEVGTAGALQQYQNQRYRAQVPGYNSPGATRIV